jgi:hypothetical protein
VTAFVVVEAVELAVGDVGDGAPARRARDRGRSSCLAAGSRR